MLVLSISQRLQKRSNDGKESFLIELIVKASYVGVCCQGEIEQRQNKWREPGREKEPIYSRCQRTQIGALPTLVPATYEFVLSPSHYSMSTGPGISLAVPYILDFRLLMAPPYLLPIVLRKMIYHLMAASAV